MTKATPTFAKRFNAQRAARKGLGTDAQEGTHFRTSKVEGGFAWEAITPDNVGKALVWILSEHLREALDFTCRCRPD